MVSSMLSYFRLIQGFWGEAMLTAYYLLNRILNKRNMIIPYELWTKRKPNPNYLRVWGCRPVVRLPDPKLITLSKRGIERIFVGYAEHSKAFRFYVIEPNESVSINSIIESRDAIIDENKFSSVPRPKEINDEMNSIMGNNTWMLADLPPACKPLGCKWIFKRKLKVDGTIEKFKARLVIQGFRQNSRIDYFDAYAPVAHISTIRLLIAMASIHNLIIHQMDVKTAFLNGELEEGENLIELVDLTKEFLSSRFSMKDMREADVILVSTLMDTSEKLILNNGQAISQLEYSRMIGCLMYAMTCTRPDIALQWVFLLGGGVISWAFKKQTCITSSVMEYEFAALAAAGKKAECAATLAKACIQMYNGKSRHLGVRHSMIYELITNEVVAGKVQWSLMNSLNGIYQSDGFNFVLPENKKMTQDVEMKEQPQVPATAAAVSNSISSPTPVLQHLKEIAALIETGAYSREVRRILRAVRFTIALRRKLKASLVSTFLDFALVAGSEAHTRLSAYLPKVT
ncbi:zinc finger, CCHC-type containing protein [Tanacetum coccineum]